MDQVAINIVMWNSSAFIQHCLQAVYCQTYPNYSATVVDNGSEDDSVATVQPWIGRGVRLIQNESNRGYAHAHNQAIAATDSTFVLTLNPDALLAPTFLEHVLRAINISSTVGSVSGKLLRISPEQLQSDVTPWQQQQNYLIDSAGLVMRKSRRQFLRGYLEDASQSCLEQVYIFGPDGAAALYRRTMLEDVAIGGQYFDELFGSHKEDVDLAWRAQLLGWESIYTPEAVAYHIRGFRPRIGWFLPRQRANVPGQVRRDAVRNRWLMLAKNEILVLFLRHLPHIVVYDLATFIYLVLFEQDSLPALLDFFRLLPQVLQQRRDIHRRRRQGSRYMRQWFT